MPTQYQLPILWICVAGGLLVLCCIVYSVANFRAVEGNAAAFSRRRVSELLWALTPMAIVIAAAAPAVRDAEPQFAQKNKAPTAIALVEHAGANATGKIETPSAHR